MNNKERWQWIINDESLYIWQCRSGLSMSRFIRLYRRDIDRYIAALLEQREVPLHGRFVYGH